MQDKDNLTHLVGGGVAGTVGAILTCPLEVVKTRLQSSASKEYIENAKVKDSVKFLRGQLRAVLPLPQNALSIAGLDNSNLSHGGSRFKRNHTLFFRPEFKLQSVPTSPGTFAEGTSQAGRRMGLLSCIRHIVAQEGPQALFRGLGPTLLGVAPSRAIYFWTYSKSKKLLNDILSPNSHQVHVFSAASGGFMSSTLTNPIWFVKTRLQLDKGRYKSVSDCIKKVYSEKGLLGFYRGITASYFGICETAIHFVIYESIKARLDKYKLEEFVVVSHFEEDEWFDPAKSECPKKSFLRFVEYMGAGAISKTVASCVAYPHEVARTRLREEGSRHRGFFNCLANVYREDGYRGLYRGLGTHLIRQIPNTAIVLATYEGFVYLFGRVEEKHGTN